MIEDSPAGLIILKAMLALKFDIDTTLAVVNGQIQAEKPNKHGTILDVDDWVSSSDEEREDISIAGSSEGGINHSLPIPGPYPTYPPEIGGMADYLYVVDCGTEVGIFCDSESSTRAVTGVVGGHQTKVRTWLEAIGLYNRLYHEGNIVRVPA